MHRRLRGHARQRAPRAPWRKNRGRLASFRRRGDGPAALSGCMPALPRACLPRAVPHRSDSTPGYRRCRARRRPLHGLRRLRQGVSLGCDSHGSSARHASAPAATGRSAEIAVKCDLCRGHDGPQCVSVCPTDAIVRLDPARDIVEVRAALGKKAHAVRPGRSRPRPFVRALVLLRPRPSVRRARAHALGSRRRWRALRSGRVRRVARARARGARHRQARRSRASLGAKRSLALRGGLHRGALRDVPRGDRRACRGVRLLARRLRHTAGFARRARGLVLECGGERRLRRGRLSDPPGTAVAHRAP